MRWLLDAPPWVLPALLVVMVGLMEGCGEEVGRGSGSATATAGITGASAGVTGSGASSAGESSGATAGDSEGGSGSSDASGTTTEGMSSTSTSTTSTSTSTSSTSTSSTSTSSTTGEATMGATSGGGMECSTDLLAKVRDFQIAHPDFEAEIGAEKGIVAADLGPDKKPVYAGGNGTKTTHGKANFDTWYNDVDGVNLPFEVVIPLSDNGKGAYAFDSGAFFPIDGQGFGDEGNPHNYHFTLELHTQFEYVGGEVFKFTGDDDLFVFVNGKLAMDLGGVHGPMSATIEMDAQAEALGITPGNVYTLDFFFAERHTSESNFHIETTIACIEVIPG